MSIQITTDCLKFSQILIYNNLIICENLSQSVAFTRLPRYHQLPHRLPIFARKCNSVHPTWTRSP